MAVPARKFEVEITMQDRIAWLEEKTDHMRSDIADIKTDIRRMDAKFDGKIDALKGNIDTLKETVNAHRVETKDAFAKLQVGRALDKVWALLAIGVLLGVMARGFNWI